MWSEKLTLLPCVFYRLCPSPPGRIPQGTGPSLCSPLHQPHEEPPPTTTQCLPLSCSDKKQVDENNSITKILSIYPGPYCQIVKKFKFVKS